MVVVVVVVVGAGVVAATQPQEPQLNSVPGGQIPTGPELQPHWKAQQLSHGLGVVVGGVPVVVVVVVVLVPGPTVVVVVLVVVVVVVGPSHALQLDITTPPSAMQALEPYPT